MKGRDSNRNGYWRWGGEVGKWHKIEVDETRKK